MEGFSEILPAELVPGARTLQERLHQFGVHAHPSGQLVDNLGIWWCPSNEEDWRKRGSGDPLPRIDHPGTVLALVALVLAGRDPRPVPGELPPRRYRIMLADAIGEWVASDHSDEALARIAREASRCLAYRVSGETSRQEMGRFAERNFAPWPPALRAMYLELSGALGREYGWKRPTTEEEGEAFAAQLREALAQRLTVAQEESRQQGIQAVTDSVLAALRGQNAHPSDLPASLASVLRDLRERAGLVDLQRVAEVSDVLQGRIVGGGDTVAPALELALAVPHLLRALQQARAEVAALRAQQTPEQAP